MTVSDGATVLAVDDQVPTISETAFVAPGARVIGGVSLGERASVWYNAVLRGDSDTITIGAESNVQDNVSIHIDKDHPVVVGERVSIGHNAVVHGCTIGDESLVGMGSVILSGAVIGKGCLIAGGAVVLEGMVVPDGSLVAGVPAKVRRELSEEELEKIRNNAAIYLDHTDRHRAAVSAL